MFPLEKSVWRERTRLTGPEVGVVVTSKAWSDSGRISFSPPWSRTQKKALFSGCYYECKIWLEVFSRLLKIDSPESFILPFFTGKVSIVTFSEGDYALYRSHNEKTSNFDILFSPPRHSRENSCRMTTAITFSRQNDGGSRAHYT